MSSGNLDKYKYLTGEDLNHKPSTVEQAKFDYSLLNKFFNKGLEEKDKKERLLKRLKNMEEKKAKQLKAIEDQERNNLMQLKKQLKDDETKNIVLIEDGLK